MDTVKTYSVNEDVQKEEPFNFSRNANWQSHYAKQYEVSEKQCREHYICPSSTGKGKEMDLPKGVRTLIFTSAEPKVSKAQGQQYVERWTRRACTIGLGE